MLLGLLVNCVETSEANRAAFASCVLNNLAVGIGRHVSNGEHLLCVMPTRIFLRMGQVAIDDDAADLATDGEKSATDLQRECDYEELVISAHLSLLLGCKYHAMLALHPTDPCALTASC